MKTAIIKPILIGVLLGAAFFALPFFFIRILLTIFLIGAVVRLLGGRFWRRRYGWGFHPAFADKIRNMSEEEYTAFRQQAQPRWPWPDRPRENPQTENK